MLLCVNSLCFSNRSILSFGNNDYRIFFVLIQLFLNADFPKRKVLELFANLKEHCISDVIYVDSSTVINWELVMESRIQKHKIPNGFPAEREEIREGFRTYEAPNKPPSILLPSSGSELSAMSQLPEDYPSICF